MMKRSLPQIRTDSRDALAGNYSVCFLALFFMFMANMALNQILYLFPVPSVHGALAVLTDVVYSIPGSLVMTMIQTGFLFLCLNVARYGRPAFNDVFLAFRYDVSKAVGLCLIIGLIDLVCSLPFNYALTDLLLAGTRFLHGLTAAQALRSVGFLILGGIATMAMRVFFVYPVSQALWLYIDHQEYSGVECLTKSIQLMRGQIVRYLKLELSFAGYLALSILSLGVGLIWVIPYINVAKANFYMDLTGTYKPY